MTDRFRKRAEITLRVVLLVTNISDVEYIIWNSPISMITGFILLINSKEMLEYSESRTNCLQWSTS